MDTNTPRWRGPRPTIVILDEAHVWASNGWEGVASVTLEHRYPADMELPVWPRQLGKQVLAKEFTCTAPLSDAGQAMLRTFLAQLLARRNRTVRRLARHLNRPAVVVGRQFDQVERVLEETGIGDGYGCLTLTQPVRPPVTWEDR
ncbi:hypothetical protein [Streptomyces sp. DSM 40484]|uniref:hypothetical protein n=1 Tax=Streptomyces kroppenstedtii TaxID=3051181 RepID=UPI0028D6DA15|nr:hypothetical protein [Streptomyces sp. DSM 40484]